MQWSLLNQPYIRQFPDAFQETPSTLPGNNVHLTVADRASTFIWCVRTLPEWRKGAVKRELQRLVDTAHWLGDSVAEKKSRIRICIDSHPLSEKLKGEH